jgi:hypothetical protein
MRNATWIFILGMTAISSCNLFYKTVFGIKDPKMETYSSINKYSATLGIDSSDIVFSKDSTSYYQLNRAFMGSPEIVVFNSHNKFRPYKSDSIACNASVDTILKRICSIDQISIVHKSLDYNYFVSLLDDHNRALENSNSTPYDYIVFVDYAKYFHKVNKNHIPGWKLALNGHHGSCSSKMIFVNLDYLESWNISKSSLPSFRLSANKK